MRILHPEDRARVLAQVARRNSAGARFRGEYRVIATDGRVVWIQDEEEIVRDAEGRPLYAQGYMLDVTEKPSAPPSSSRRWSRRSKADAAAWR